METGTGARLHSRQKSLEISRTARPESRTRSAKQKADTPTSTSRPTTSTPPTARDTHGLTSGTTQSKTSTTEGGERAGVENHDEVNSLRDSSCALTSRACPGRQSWSPDHLSSASKHYPNQTSPRRRSDSSKVPRGPRHTSSYSPAPRRKARSSTA